MFQTTPYFFPMYCIYGKRSLHWPRVFNIWTSAFSSYLYEADPFVEESPNVHVHEVWLHMIELLNLQTRCSLA